MDGRPARATATALSYISYCRPTNDRTTLTLTTSKNVVPLYHRPPWRRLPGLGYYAYLAALPKPLPGIPYNKHSAKRIFGDIPDLIAHRAATGEASAWYKNQCVEHNTPVVQLFMKPFDNPSVLVSDHRETKDVVSRWTREFDRSDFFGDLFKANLPGCMVQMKTNDDWKAHRRLMADTMSASFLDNVAGPQIYDSILELLNLWKLKARFANGRPFHVGEDIKQSALNTISAATFGEKIGVAQTQIDLLSSYNDPDLPQDKNRSRLSICSPTSSFPVRRHGLRLSLDPAELPVPNNPPPDRHEGRAQTPQSRQPQGTADQRRHPQSLGQVLTCQ